MNEKREKLAAEIEAALPHFTGTDRKSTRLNSSHRL